MTAENLQANSFPCAKCGRVWSEESGAYKGFVCEDCVSETRGLSIANGVSVHGILRELCRLYGSIENLILTLLDTLPNCRSECKCEEPEIVEIAFMWGLGRFCIKCGGEVF